MAKPLATMTRANDVASGARDLSQRRRRARRMLADPAFNQSPPGFDGIEIVRVRRQKVHGGAARLDKLADRRRFVRVEIVQQDDIPSTEPWRQAGAHPLLKAGV